VPSERILKTVGRFIARAVTLLSGVLALGLTVFLLHRTAIGAPVGPHETLSLILYLTFFAFILSGAVTWWIEHSRVKALEREMRAPAAMEAAKAQRELLELKEWMRPRLITDRPAMLARLMTLPRGNIDISYLSAHEEPFRFAAELKEILTAGGWKVTNFDDVSGSVPTGLVISVRDAGDPPPRARALKMILEGEGLAVTYDPGNPIRDPDAVGLFVGSKPHD
jgi:hypothetical protein